MHARYLSILVFLLGLKAMAMVWVILHAGIGLGPDEAQYWTWSQLLDWGYYSKPPGIAWEIWTGTQLFGNTELGVRLMAVVVGFFTPLVVYLMAKNCQLTPVVCFWAALTMALSPLGMLASFLAITDGGMVFFWTAACAYLAGKIQRDETPSYILLGMLIMCGALFKWPIYCLWILIIVSWIYYPKLASWRIFPGIIVSLFALVPSIYWNAMHDWATFRHVFATIGGGHAKPKVGAWLGGSFPDFIGAQAALVSPILFILLWLALWRMFKQRRVVAPGVLFCGGITLIILAVASVLALFMKLQGNWAIFAYPSAFVVLGWYACEFMPQRKKWLMAGLAFSILACSVIFSIPTIHARPIRKLIVTYS